MQVTHPRANDAPTPSAVTVDGSDYAIDADGVVEAPEDVAEQIAAAWARRFGADAEALLGGADTCDVVKQDGEVCGRKLPCPYHSDDSTDDGGE